jgi:hypothetical protein
MASYPNPNIPSHSSPPQIRRYLLRLFPPSSSPSPPSTAGDRSARTALPHAFAPTIAADAPCAQPHLAGAVLRRAREVEAISHISGGYGFGVVDPPSSLVLTSAAALWFLRLPPLRRDLATPSPSTPTSCVAILLSSSMNLSSPKGQRGSPPLLFSF